MAHPVSAGASACDGGAEVNPGCGRSWRRHIPVHGFAAEHLQSVRTTLQQPLLADRLLPLQAETIRVGESRGQRDEVLTGLWALAVELAPALVVAMDDQAIVAHAGLGQ